MHASTKSTPFTFSAHIILSILKPKSISVLPARCVPFLLLPEWGHQDREGRSPFLPVPGPSFLPLQHVAHQTSAHHGPVRSIWTEAFFLSICCESGSWPF